MTSRAERITESLGRAELDGLLCFLPENILFLSGYWPSTGDSAVVVTRRGQQALVLPSVDKAFVPKDWNGLLVCYDIDPADIQAGSPRDKVVQSLTVALKEFGLGAGRLGCELTFETVAGSFRGSEANVPGPEMYDSLKKQLPRLTVEDSSDLIRYLRRLKTSREIEAFKRCNRIADYAFSRVREAARPGVTEIELAAIMESAFQERGVSVEAAGRARGYAFVMSGPVNSANAWLPANFSTRRALQEGDLVLIEFNGFADGYWTDLSRTIVIGEPSKRQQQMIQAVTEVLETAVRAVKPGVTAGSIDELARKSFRSFGLEQNFLHYIGHAVGFAFHERPILKSDSDVLLEPGMILAIEPGLYIEAVGGIRIEDNLVVTNEGADCLSNCERRPIL
jgi:Xaa-Pro aminopeptidase